MTSYGTTLETNGTSWTPTSPDLPGCVAVGDTREEVAALIRAAILLHSESLRQQAQADETDCPFSL